MSSVSPPVEAVDVVPIVGVPKVEPLRHLLARVVRVAVELQAVAEQTAEVAEQLQVVLDGRVAPDLRRVRHVGVAGRDERRRVGALHAAVGRVRVAVLQAQVGEAVGAERQADVAGHAVGVTVAGPVCSGADVEAAPRRVVLEQEVQHAGDRIGAVLRRGAVAQHLHLPQGDGGDGGDVRSLRAVGHPGEPGDDRRAVAALAVDQHQRVVVGEVADAGRPHEGGRVADRVRGDVERGNERPQLVVEGRQALGGDVLERDGVYRYLRLGHRPRLRATADHDHPLLELDGQLRVESDRGPGADLHCVAHGLLEAGQRERHLVGAGRQRDREHAGAVGDDGRGLIAAASRASTVTPGSTRPVVSVTVPEMPASWAPVAGQRRKRAERQQDRQRNSVRSLHRRSLLSSRAAAVRVGAIGVYRGDDAMPWSGHRKILAVSGCFLQVPLGPA